MIHRRVINEPPLAFQLRLTVGPPVVALRGDWPSLSPSLRECTPGPARSETDCPLSRTRYTTSSRCFRSAYFELLLVAFYRPLDKASARCPLAPGTIKRPQRIERP